MNYLVAAVAFGLAIYITTHAWAHRRVDDRIEQIILFGVVVFSWFLAWTIVDIVVMGR